MKGDPLLATRILPAGHRDGCERHAHVVKVHGGLHMMRGNHAPYFSLTYDSHRDGHPNQCESGGAGHEFILRLWPKFADLAALHLSDIDGEPLHAEANGWYNLAGALDGYGEEYHVGNSEHHFPVTPPPDKPWANTAHRRPTVDECLQLFADYVRVPLAEAAQIRDAVRAAGLAAREAGDRTGTDERRGARLKWREIMDAMRPRWQAEAAACIAKHGLRVYGDAWPVAS